MSVNSDHFFHLVFQITQECPFYCEICLRYYDKGISVTSLGKWREMIDELKGKGLKRLTVTGGEPTILGEKLFEFLRYTHNQKIHTSLATTGYSLTERNIREMDSYLDHLLISVRSLELSEWVNDFGDTKHTKTLFDTVENIIKLTSDTGILLEVNSVVHSGNKEKILNLGRGLYKLNPKIIWRIENYYANGLMVDLRPRFELDEFEFEKIIDKVREEFDGMFSNIRFIRKQIKESSPGYLITQSGDFVLTSNHTHEKTEFNAFEKKMPEKFEMIRSWQEYKEISRDWGWEDFA